MAGRDLTPLFRRGPILALVLTVVSPVAAQAQVVCWFL